MSAAVGLQGSPQRWNGLLVYDASGTKLGGWKEIPRNARLHFRDKPGLVVTLVDAWSGSDASSLLGLRVASFVPVEHDPLPERIRTHLLLSGATTLAVTRSGEELLHAAGLEPLFVPHGVDTAIFRPQDRAEARRQLRLPQQAFIVGMVAVNKADNDRKSFPEAFEAFARFRERHTEALLLVHTLREGGTNLGVLAAQLGIEEAVLFPDDDAMRAGLHTVAYMAALYASLNVLLSPSRGEGFGLPLLEAQACGVPVIVTDFGAMAEIGAVGWRVGGQRLYDRERRAWWVVPNVEEIVLALDAAYEQADSLADAARTHALSYDADLVTERYLLPALEEVAKREPGIPPDSLPLSVLTPL